MNSDYIVAIARKSILSVIPDVLQPCSILKTENQFNAATQKSQDVVLDLVQCECIPENITDDEIQASKILSTDLKFHILNHLKIDIDYYNKIQINSVTYTIIKTLKYNFGQDIPIITLYVRK